MRWARLAAAGAALAATWACTSHRLGIPQAEPAVVKQRRIAVGTRPKVDILFVIDDSPSMRPLQDKLAARLPDFMRALEDVDGGFPDAHIAVTSTSMGAGMSLVGQCEPNTIGNRAGAFVHPAACAALPASERYLVVDRGTPNFTGDIADVFACMAKLGDTGCGFEQPLVAAVAALSKGANPDDPDNGGFLREDAVLAIVLVTNEDDCSVPGDSLLFDPRETTLADPRGGLQSYRCNEFGHLCDGQRPPHMLAAGATFTPAACVSNEDGDLIPVHDLSSWIMQLKDDPRQILVAALAGPSTPYTVESKEFALSSGGKELQPAVRHSCTQRSATAGAEDEYADPAVRVKQWVDAFPPESRYFDTICTDDFRPAMKAIGDAVAAIVRHNCIGATVPTTSKGQPDCQVSASSVDNPKSQTTLSFCDTTLSKLPCWRLVDSPACTDGPELQVCQNPDCDPTKPPSGGSIEVSTATVTCAVAKP